MRRRIEECISEFLAVEREALRLADGLADGSVDGKRTRRGGTCLRQQYAELVQFRLLVPPRIRPVHGRQLGGPVHAPPYVNNEAAGEK
ncbi:hypothetical protein GCM10020256_24100 [Streptomyces thermocoprophilus]